MLKLAIYASYIICSEAAAGELLRSNWREECRSAISGLHLSAIDGAQVQAAYAETLEKGLAKLRLSLSTADKALTTARNAVEKEPYTVKGQEALTAAQFKLRTVTEQIETNERLLAQSQQERQSLEQRAQDLQAKMRQVFHLTKVEVSHRTAYNFKVEYLSPCPQYQLLCPLPAAQAKALLTLLPDGELPVACSRYAQLPTPAMRGQAKP